MTGKARAGWIGGFCVLLLAAAGLLAGRQRTDPEMWEPQRETRERRLRDRRENLQVRAVLRARRLSAELDALRREAEELSGRLAPRLRPLDPAILPATLAFLRPQPVAILHRPPQGESVLLHRAPGIELSARDLAERMAGAPVTDRTLLGRPIELAGRRCLPVRVSLEPAGGRGALLLLHDLDRVAARLAPLLEEGPETATLLDRSGRPLSGPPLLPPPGGRVSPLLVHLAESRGAGSLVYGEADGRETVAGFAPLEPPGWTVILRRPLDPEPYDG